MITLGTILIVIISLLSVVLQWSSYVDQIGSAPKTFQKKSWGILNWFESIAYIKVLFSTFHNSSFLRSVYVLIHGRPFDDPLQIQIIRGYPAKRTLSAMRKHGG